jgi:hypothetical protein
MRQPSLLDLGVRRRLLSGRTAVNVGVFGRACKDRCGALRTDWSDLTMSACRREADEEAAAGISGEAFRQRGSKALNRPWLL